MIKMSRPRLVFFLFLLFPLFLPSPPPLLSPPYLCRVELRHLATALPSPPPPPPLPALPLRFQLAGQNQARARYATISRSGVKIRPAGFLTPSRVGGPITPPVCVSTSHPSSDVTPTKITTATIHPTPKPPHPPTPPVRHSTLQPRPAFVVGGYVSPPSRPTPDSGPFEMLAGGLEDRNRAEGVIREVDELSGLSGEGHVLKARAILERKGLFK